MAKSNEVNEVNTPSVAEKVYELTLELLAAEKEKKELVKAHGDNVKRIKAEIKDLMNSEQDEVDSTRKTSDE